MRKITMLTILTFISLGAYAVETSTQPTTPSTTQPTMAADASPIEKIGHDAFMKAPGLTDAQKIKLGEIMKNTFNESQKIKLEIADQKVSLFEAITNPTAKSSDVTKIKNKITDLDKKRLALMFKSLDEVQKVIGKNPETGKYLRNIMRERIQVDDHNK